MKTYLKKLLIKLSGNDYAQDFLEKNVAFCQYLMGIGAGSDVLFSGEKALAQHLRWQYLETKQALCVFDVGANQGQFIQLIQDGLKAIPVVLHAFEPSNSAFETLVEKKRDLTNVYLNNFGLGKQRGNSTLYYDQPGSGLASLSKRRLDHFSINFNFTENIQIETLDEYCFDRHIENIDLLKLDVEGHELDVLHGSLKTFQSGKVRALTFEFGGGNIDSHTYFQDFWYLLQEYGMRNVFRITPSGYFKRIREYREMDEQFRTTNYFVLREETRSTRI